MESEGKLAKPFFIENAYPLLKGASAILGTLYVLGLLISNLQLMELGVADFSSFPVRNIMTGLVFLVYVLLLLLSLAPVPAMMYACLRIKRRTQPGILKKIFHSVGAVLAFVVFGISVASTVGTLLGYLYPWGRRWDQVVLLGRTTWTWSFMKSDLLRTMGQFRDSYQYPKVVVVGIAISFFAVWIVLIRNWEVPESHKQTIQRVLHAKYSTAAAATYLFLAISLLLVGFADEVYPNIKYNLGGGQPQVAELQIGEDKAPVAGLTGIPLCCGIVNPGGDAWPVAIWYQSDKFLYVSPLPRAEHSDAQMVAIDIKLIRAIHYLPKYVRIESGGRIRSVGSY